MKNFKFHSKGFFQNVPIFNSLRKKLLNLIEKLFEACNIIHFNNDVVKTFSFFNLFFSYFFQMKIFNLILKDFSKCTHLNILKKKITT
jgi:hypothetical protein